MESMRKQMKWFRQERFIRYIHLNQTIWKIHGFVRFVILKIQSEVPVAVYVAKHGRAK